MKPKEITEDSVTLTWSPPDDNGGSPVTKYVIERREANKRSWNNVTSTSDLELKIPNLREGQAYCFRIAAENEVGRGEYAETEPITPKSKFGGYYLQGGA